MSAVLQSLGSVARSKIPSLLSCRRNLATASTKFSLYPASASRTVICDNPGSVARARGILEEAPYIIFDCEGHCTRLPCGTKSVSLVQLGTPHAEDVFLFDMLALRNHGHATRSVLSLLCNPGGILKVGWGVIEDVSAISRVYNRSITPFLDLQLVDIHSRVRRRETREAQISRLASSTFPSSEIEKLQIDGVHKLSSMDQALAEHSLDDVPKKERHRAAWPERPLTSSDILYAANDIIRISGLHNHFKKTEIFSKAFLADVIKRTALYTALYGRSGILTLRKRFVPPNILPLEIIGVETGRNNFFTKNRDLRKCRCCHRFLSRESFPMPDLRVGVYGGGRSRACKVCTFGVKKEEYALRSAAKSAKNFMNELLKLYH